jgi:hypothetical protein
MHHKIQILVVRSAAYRVGSMRLNRATRFVRATRLAWAIAAISARQN